MDKDLHATHPARGHLDLVLDVGIEWARRRRNRSVTVVAVEIEHLGAMRAHLRESDVGELLAIIEARLSRLRSVTSVRTGDGFVLVSTGPRSHFDAFSLGNRAARTVSRPVVVGGIEIVPSASVGIRLARNGNGDGPMLLRDAQFAVDEAKRRGRGEIVVFSSELFLRRMSARPDFRMQFEPIVSLDDGHVATYEATVLPGPTPGFGDADASELELLLDALARAMTAWPLEVDASFNVSAPQLLDHRFPDLVLTTADRYSLEPDRFVFEIDANQVTEDITGTQDVLTRLREDGWRVGVDGVGATTPLLHTLALLPARFVKIDRTLVEGADPTMWDLLSISDAARSLGVTTVATGIRTLPELALAIAHEFDLAQGPLFGFQPPHATTPI